MTRKLFLLIFLIPFTAYSQVITDGLVGYWPFNGNANDESGNGNDGVVNGATLTEDRFGNPNSAYSFDGTSNQYIQTPSGSLNIDTDLTISAWIKTSSSADQDIFTQFRSISPYDGYGLGLGVAGCATGRLSFWDGASWRCASSDVQDGNWHHVVAVSDDSNIHFFVDGNFDGSPPGNNPLSYTGTGKIGTTPNNSRDFNGTIDDIGIYNRALTEEEIQILYSGNFPEPTPQLCETIFCDGQNVGISTPNTHGYKLAVAGDIITEEIKVATQTNWPDYVFHPEHQIPSLEELEQYIQLNQKLPGIPSALEAESNGIELGEMNRLLLEKIEELTLYVIELKKEIEILKSE